MSNLKPNYFWQFLFVIGTLFTTKSYSQNCAIVINNVKHPTSCYASDGSITVTATDQPGNPCERTVKLLKDNVQIAEGQATLSVGNLSSGMYSVIAINGCGCSQVQTKEVFLNGGTSTKLTPYADKGSGFYQAKNVYVCRGGTVKLGTQPLGITGFTITGPNGFTSSSPQGSSYFTLTNVQPSQTGQYTIKYTNGYGCISETAIYLEVGALSVNAGQDQAACFGSSFTLTASGSGQATCKNTCSVGTDSLLVKWTLDQCNAQGATNQDSYTEFIPEFPNTGNCTDVDAGNIYRDKGEHSCTPIIGSYPDDVGMCIPSMESCDPLDYDSDYAIKFSVSLTPSQIGRLSKLTFYEQSPFNWITTNGSTGINNYNTKYLIRVYKNDILIFEENERATERSWNLETFDFSSIEEFNIYEPSTFRFELRGYCVVENNGVMNGWELNDIRVYGGCCINNNVENPISYIWSNGATTSTIVVTPLETTTYTVSVVDCKGCVSSDEVKTTVYPLPVASITGSGEICFGDSAILTAQGGSSYHWSTGEVASTIEVKPAETTTYFVTVTSTDGCTSVASHQVIVHKLPTPVISGDFDLCIGESTTLSASGGLSYIWSNGSTTNTITITPTSTINISVTTTDNHGCQNATSETIIVHPLPVPSIIGKSEICYGESTVLEADGGISYLWSTGETTKSIVVNPIINSTYSVTVTSEFGCVESTQKEIVVHALPIVSISGNSEICFGSNLELVATGGISYMWSTGQTSPAITVHPGIETSYSVTATDVHGCMASSSKVVHVNPLPEANISGDEKICFGEQIQLNGSGGTQYFWSNGSTTSIINVSPTSTTFYYLTVTDEHGCQATAVHSVIVNPNPDLSIVGDSEICIGNSAKLTATVTGKTFCDKDCADELLVTWNLDDCNALGSSNQMSYDEFTPEINSYGDLKVVTATNINRDSGDHSCTPDGLGGAGICIENLTSCDPNDYNSQNALRFSVSIDPKEVGKINTLTFREQSPYNWITTNGSTGINNINTKYLIRVYKNNKLIYSKNDILTERSWNLETFDFSNHPEFRVEELSKFDFELYGYCVEDRGGMTGWEIDDVRIYGGECPSSMSANNLNFVWSTNETTSMITVSPPATTIYSVTVKDCNGCSASKKKEIKVNPLPNISIQGDIEICQGSSTVLTASGGSSYSWNTGESGNSITVSPSVTTTYTVTVTSDQGCISTGWVTVTVHPLPSVTIQGDIEICLGGSSTLTTSGGSSYAWNTGESGSSITVSPNETTIYTVTVTSDHGCVSTGTVTVTVHPLPSVTIQGDKEICINGSSTLTASGGSSYHWSTGESSNDITVSPSATTTYTVTVTSDHRCISTGWVTVTVHPLPSVTIDGDKEICIGGSSTLTASGGSSYHWSTGDNGSSITVNPSATTTYTVTVTSDHGCVSTGTFTVTVHPLPSVTIEGDSEICYGSSTVLTASGGSNYSWSTGDNGSSITVSPNATTTYTVTVTSDHGCVSTGTATVTVHPMPIVTIQGDIDICMGGSSILTASGGSTYSWSIGASGSSITVSPSATTTYTVTVTSDQGCISTGWVTVTVHPLPSVAIQGDKEICIGGSSTLTASGGSSYSWSTGASGSGITVTPNATTTYTVTVTSDQGCISTGWVTVTVHPLPSVTIQGDKDICINGSSTLTASGGSSYHWSTGDNGSSITVSPSATTTYTVTVTSDHGCVSTGWVTVAVHPLPSVTIQGDKDICINGSSTLTASGGSSYHWSTGDNGSSITVSPSATTTYTVTVTSDHGCVSTGTVTVTVHPLPSVMIEGDNEICMGGSTVLTASGGSSYSWSTGASGSSITVSPNETTTYTVTVTSDHGCVSTGTVTVTAHPLPEIIIEGDTTICAGSCTTLTVVGDDLEVEWQGVGEGVEESCPDLYFVGGLQDGGVQSLYKITGTDLIKSYEIGPRNINGIGSYCDGRSMKLYGMERMGDNPLTATRSNLVVLDVASGGVNVLGEIPQPTNIYGGLGQSGIISFVGDVDRDGNYYFPAINAFINPSTYEILDYTVYIGRIDLNNHGNGSNVSYEVLRVLPDCKPYMDACVSAFQAYALDPSIGSPSGGIQDWALSSDGNTLYSFLGIENGLLKIDLASQTASCVGGPASNLIYTGTTGVKTDEFGGIALRDGELYGYQVDRGRYYRIDKESGELTLLTEGWPEDYRGDISDCKPCGGNEGVNGSTATVCPEETTSYTVKVTDPRGCMSTRTVRVEVLEKVEVTIQGDTEICKGETTSLSVGGGYRTVTWSTGETTERIDVSPLERTTYGVTVEDASGCTGTTTQTVEVHPLPIVEIYGEKEICKGGSTVLIAYGGGSYAWSTGASSSGITVSPNATTTYTVTVTSDHGCVSTGTVTVTVHPLPSVTIDGDKDICVGGSTVLTASGGNTYTWSTGESSNGITVTPSATTTYTVTITSDHGCVSTGTVTVTVHPLPSVTIDGDKDICINGSSTLTASGGSNYSWSTGDNGSSITVSPSATTTYTVTVTSDQGCISTGWVTVTVHPLPSVTIEGDKDICINGSSTLTASGGSSYSWSTGASGSGITVTPNATTTYTVTVTSDQGCVSTGTVTVTVHPLPSVTIEGDSEICIGGSSTLTASGGSNYSWSTGESGSSITVTPNATTTYTVTVTSDHGCVSTGWVTVAVHPLPSVTIQGDKEICINGSSTLTASGGSSYHWSTGDNGSSITVSPSATTTYTVTVTSDQGCVSTGTVTVTVHPLPSVTIEGDNEICMGGSTVLTASGGSSYSWSTGASGSSITVSPNETTTYTVTVTSDHGCVSTGTVTVTAHPLPEIIIEGDTTICAGSCTTLTVVGDDLEVEWQGVGEGVEESCPDLYFVGGLQDGGVQSLYKITGTDLIKSYEIGPRNINGIGSYCDGRSMKLYGMERMGDNPLTATRSNLVVLDVASGGVNVLGEIPQPTNIYGGLGQSGIISFVGDVDRDGNYYFPAINAFINPSTYEILDYTVYIGRIDLNNHGNGSNVSYEVLRVLPDCKPYMDACVSAFQAYALDPSIGSPSGGIQDWALSSDGNTLYSFLGIENGLLKIDLASQTASCVGGPASNLIYTGTTGVKTDEFGGIALRDGELYGYQVDRGRYYRIDKESGELTLLTEGWPEDYRGDISDCKPCGGNEGVNGSTATVCPEETTSYTVKVTDPRGCMSTRTVRVEVLEKVEVTIQGDTEICKGETTSLSVGGGYRTVTWSTGETTERIDVSPLERTTYGVTVEDASGCTGTTTQTVEVHPLPIVEIYGEKEICKGGSTVLIAYGGGSYAWSTGASSSGITVSPSVTTTYTVTVTSDHGCVSTGTVTVTVHPLPSVTIDGDKDICVGGSTVLTASGGNTYTWSTGESSNGITVTPSATTTYTVTITSDHGCVSTGTVTVTVHPLPSVTIDGDKDICIGGSSTLTASGGSSYHWSTGDNGSSITVSPSATTTYTVTVTSDQGCISTGWVTVTVHPLPSVTIEGDKDICINGSSTLTASGGSSYHWSTGASGSGITVTPNATTTYTVTVTSDQGCISTGWVTVTVHPLPSVTIQGDSDICLGGSSTLTASGGSNYSWSTGDNGSSITVSPSATTTYTVTVTSDHGCVSTGTVTVTVHPLPSVTIQGDKEICINGSSTLTASGGSTYTWSTGESGSSITVTPNATTTYTVTVTSDHGCISTGWVTVTVHPLPSVTIEGDQEICINGSSTLTASGGSSYAWNTGESGSSITVSPNATTTYTVTVTSDQGCISTGWVTVTVHPLPSVTIQGDSDICLGGSSTLTASGGRNYSWSTGDNGSSITVSPNATTTYTVTVTSDHGCVSTGTVTVTVHPLPTVNINGDTKICVGSSTMLEATGGVNYHWSTGQNTKKITVNPDLATTYTVTVTSEFGCSATSSVTVMIKSKPNIEFSGPDILCLGDSTFIVVTGTTSNECANQCNVTNPEVLAYWDLEDCSSFMTNGTHLDYSEFTPVINKSNCVNVSAGNVHRYNWLKHSCTPGINDGVGMCIGTQNTCSPSHIDYTEALRFMVTIDPSKSAQITGLQFAEQSPENYLFVGGTPNTNNYAQKFLIRVSKNGQIVYYKDNIPTHRLWGNVSFDFANNPNFKGVGKSVYLFELVPYCIFDNGGLESIWDIDEIKVYGGCCEGIEKEVTYVWSDGSTGSSIHIQPSENTSYTVTVTDCCGCTNVLSKDIYVSDLKADLGPDRMIIRGQTITLTPVISGKSICSDTDLGVNEVKYLWSNGATTSSITVTPTASTFYRVTVEDCNECTDTESISIYVMNGSQISIYPNPAKDKVNITSREVINDHEFSVSLMSVDGRRISILPESMTKENNFQYSVVLPSNIVQGVYLMNVDVNGVKVTERIVILGN